MAHGNRTAPVSVVIPCFRCAATIGRAVQSVAGQSLRPAEVILVDDCSGDRTRTLLEAIAASHPPGWIKLVGLSRNGGAATARNRGWDSASQPFIAFLDADDAWHPRKLEIQYPHMARNPELALCAHLSRRIEAGLDAAPLPPAPETVAPRRVGPGALMLSNRFITPSVMLRRDIGFRFLEGRRYMEDHLLWLRLALSGKHLEILPLALAYTFKPAYGAAGLSSKMLPMALGDLANYRELRREGLIGAALAWPLYGFSILKTCRRALLAIFAGFRSTPDHP
jgi:glycosyltransferase involved in cell wall biosynthesis